jgi:hypothetical protein
MINYALPRLRDILFLSIFLAVLLLGPKMLNQDGDLPRHLAVGRTILENAHIPIYDVFSHSNTGKPFAPHEWLAGVCFYIIYSVAGLNGIVLLAALLLASTFTLLYTLGVEKSNSNLFPFVLVTWGASISSLHWITRPHLFSMFFLAIWLLLIDKLFQNKKYPVWILPTIMLVWGNMHGEFIAGFLVLAAYLCGWAWDYFITKTSNNSQIGLSLSVVTGLSFLASCLNPVGIKTWTTVIGYLGNRYLISHTNETNPPDFSQSKFLVLLALIAFAIILLVIRKNRVETGHAFLLAGFTAMSLISARNVHLYGIVAPFVLFTCYPLLPSDFFLSKMDNTLKSVEGKLKGIAWPIATFLIFAFLLNFSQLGKINRFDPNFFPIKASEWLEQNPQQGNMFNAFDWGGYMIFRFWPNYRVFIDSQTDVYGEDFTRKYEAIISQTNNWEKYLDEYKISWVIIPSSWPLANYFNSTPPWHLVYTDKTTSIFSK